MRLTAKSEYGVLAAIDLACNYGSGPISAREIAERRGIPPRFLEQLFVSRPEGLTGEEFEERLYLARKEMERKRPTRRKTEQYWTEGQFGTLLKAEVEKWSPIIRKSGVYAD